MSTRASVSITARVDQAADELAVCRPSASSGPNAEPRPWPLNRAMRGSRWWITTASRPSVATRRTPPGPWSRASVWLVEIVPAHAGQGGEAERGEREELGGEAELAEAGEERGHPPVDAAVAVPEVAIEADRGGVVGVERADVRDRGRRPSRPACGPPRSGWCTGRGCPTRLDRDDRTRARPAAHGPGGRSGCRAASTRPSAPEVERRHPDLLADCRGSVSASIQ